MHNGLFLLTSNFPTEAEARRILGPAMFSRISACVAFTELSADEKATIARGHYDKIIAHLDEEDARAIEGGGILAWFAENAERYSNMRTMKTKVEKAIFGRLSAPIFENYDSPEPKE